MKIFPTILLLFSFGSAAIFSACAGDAAVNSNAGLPQNSASRTANSNENAAVTKDNVEILMTIIKLPFEPEESVWREDSANNRNSSAGKKRLTAILRFSASDAEKTVAQARNYKPPTQTQIQTEDWFPAELIAQSELSGDETIKGTSYAADDFIQTPFTGGQITRIENSNYFILEISSE